MSPPDSHSEKRREKERKEPHKESSHDYKSTRQSRRSSDKFTEPQLQSNEYFEEASIEDTSVQHKKRRQEHHELSDNTN